MLTVSSAPRSIGAVVDDALKLWQSAFGRTWLLAAVAAALGVGPYLWVLVRWRLTGAPPTMSIYRSGSVAFSVFTVILQIIESAVGYAILIQTAAVAFDTPKSIGRALRRGFKLIPRGLVKFFMLIAATFLLVPVFVAITMIRVATSPSAPAFLAVTFVVCFAMCIFGYLRVQFYSMYMVLGDSGAVDSLTSAWRLVRGHWWRVCATTAIFAALYLVALAACTAVLGALYGILSIPRTVIFQFFQGTMSIVSALFAPVTAASRIHIFLDLKARTHGSDLANRVAMIVATP